MTALEPLHKRMRLSRILVRLGPDGPRITRLFNELDGKISIREARFLFTIAKDRATIVEIGPHRGKSTVMVAMGAGLDREPNAARMLSIDPHSPHNPGQEYKSNYDRFLETLRQYGLEGRIEHWREYSQAAVSHWDQSPIDLLWIDGSHNYEDKCADFRDWGAFVAKGGIIVAHDTFRPRIPDVMRAWKDVIEADPSWGPTRRCHSIAWAEKVTEAPGR